MNTSAPSPDNPLRACLPSLHVQKSLKLGTRIAMLLCLTTGLLAGESMLVVGLLGGGLERAGAGKRKMLNVRVV